MPQVQNGINTEFSTCQITVISMSYMRLIAYNIKEKLIFRFA
jgi:hypothetical protein